MENFINKLYMGQFHQDCIKDKEFLEERSKKLDTASSTQTQLEKTLSDEQKKLLKQLLEDDADIWTDEVDYAFARGVKIGMLLQNSLDKIQL